VSDVDAATGREGSRTGSRWTRYERILLIGLVLAYVPGIPGLGVDTREASSASVTLGIVYGVASLAPLIALAASWKWPLAAAWVGIIAGVLAVALPVLDLSGVLIGPPPAGMIVVNVVVAILGAVVAWRSRRLAR